MTDTRNRNDRAANGAKNFYIPILIFLFQAKFICKKSISIFRKISALQKF